MNHKMINYYTGIRALLIAIVSLFLTMHIACSNTRNISSNSNSNGLHQPPDINPLIANDYYENNFMRYGDFIYHNNIKTILFAMNNWEFSTPIIELNSQETLLLSFDDLDADFKNYAYTIIHCDALWQPSQLSDYEYIEGFNQDLITNYSFSRNTRVQFTHYNLEFPNSNMRPLLSGNYIMKVFIDGDPDNVVFTRRFMVYQPLVSLSGVVSQATNLDFRNTMQEIDFTITSSTTPISNPYRDLKVTVTQNGRWDNAITTLKPKLVQGNSLIYDYEDGNLFAGGNEFRNFDTKSLRYRSLSVEDILPVNNGWQVNLIPDRSRQFMRYTSKGDINGRLLIKTDDYQDDLLEADYTWVVFTLPYEQPIVNGNVYILGGLSDWNLGVANKMEYNYRDARYEIRLLLKQGFYDYMYAFLEDGKDVADVTPFEGSHSITENDYTIYVYYRQPGDLYDSLIGVHHINSGL